MQNRRVVIIGRPNVGKSAIFNRLAGKRIAIVHDEKGITRDRIMTEVCWGGELFELIDTGGITFIDRRKSNEIISNAISSVTRDPRFPPVRPDELDDLKISVDVLSEPEKIDSINLLDPKKYGVIVKTIDGRSGLLLPDIEGINYPYEQVAIACAKAGILPHEKIELQRFTVERHK